MPSNATTDEVLVRRREASFDLKSSTSSRKLTVPSNLILGRTTTDASFALRYLQSVASPERSCDSAFGAAVGFTDRRFGVAKSVVNVTALGDDLPQAIKKAYDAVHKVNFEGSRYRTDIGQKALAHLAD